MQMHASSHYSKLFNNSCYKNTDFKPQQLRFPLYDPDPIPAAVHVAARG